MTQSIRLSRQRILFTSFFCHERHSWVREYFYKKTCLAIFVWKYHHSTSLKSIPLRIDIITVLPELLNGPFSESIVKRAQLKGLVEIYVHNLRDYSTHKQKSVVHYPYGGGAGMVMSIEPIANCIESLQQKTSYDEVIFMTPDGEVLQQAMSNQLSLKQKLLILCGHYKGIDERIREHFITKEISIGSYVLSGGELAAAVLTDSIVRLIPGVLGDETSAL